MKVFIIKLHSIAKMLVWFGIALISCGLVYSASYDPSPIVNKESSNYILETMIIVYFFVHIMFWYDEFKNSEKSLYPFDYLVRDDFFNDAEYDEYVKDYFDSKKNRKFIPFLFKKIESHFISVVPLAIICSVIIVMLAKYLFGINSEVKDVVLITYIFLSVFSFFPKEDLEKAEYFEEVAQEKETITKENEVTETKETAKSVSANENTKVRNNIYQKFIIPILTSTISSILAGIILYIMTH